jgi:hypothetical protein
MSNDVAPHRAIITIYAEVHELIPGTGECHGVPQAKIKKLVTLDGQDKPITIRKLNELLQEIVKQCQS